MEFLRDWWRRRRAFLEYSSSYPNHLLSNMHVLIEDIDLYFDLSFLCIT